MTEEERAAQYLRVYEVEFSGGANQTIMTPVTGSVLRIGVKRGQLVMFVVTEIGSAMEPRHFRLVHENEDVPKAPAGYDMLYMGSDILPHSQRWVHVIEYRRNEAPPIFTEVLGTDFAAWLAAVQAEAEAKPPEAKE